MVDAKIYLPTAAENYDEAEEHIIKWFTEDFDGCTVYSARGAWENAEGDIVREETTVFGTVANENRSDVYDAVTAIAKGVYNVTEEDTIMAVVDGEKILIGD